MKKLIYYLTPVLITTIFVYSIGLIKSCDFNPEHFGYKTRLLLSGLWTVIAGCWLAFRRWEDMD